MWRRSVLLLLLMASSSQVCLATGEVRTDVGDFAAGEPGILLPGDLLWTSDCKSLTACAVTCMTDHNTATFTVSSRTASVGHRQCRCYSTHLSIMSRSDVLHTNIRLYQFRRRLETVPIHNTLLTTMFPPQTTLPAKINTTPDIFDNTSLSTTTPATNNSKPTDTTCSTTNNTTITATATSDDTPETPATAGIEISLVISTLATSTTLSTTLPSSVITDTLDKSDHTPVTTTTSQESDESVPVRDPPASINSSHVDLTTSALDTVLVTINDTPVTSDTSQEVTSTNDIFFNINNNIPVATDSPDTKIFSGEYTSLSGQMTTSPLAIRSSVETRSSTTTVISPTATITTTPVIVNSSPEVTSYPATNMPVDTSRTPAGVINPPVTTTPTTSTSLQIPTAQADINNRSIPATTTPTSSTTTSTPTTTSTIPTTTTTTLRNNLTSSTTTTTTTKLTTPALTWTGGSGFSCPSFCCLYPYRSCPCPRTRSPLYSNSMEDLVYSSSSRRNIRSALRKHDQLLYFGY